MESNSLQLPRLNARPSNSHKGSYGKILVVAGSRGMSGAAILCGTSALRSGAGLVQVATPTEVALSVSLGNPCFTTASLPQDLRGRIASASLEDLLELCEWANVVAIGPGLGRADAHKSVLKGLLKDVQKPIVVDADGLYSIKDLSTNDWRLRVAPTVITPHPGEFAHLLGITIAEVEANRERLAIRFAEERGIVVLLKGHRTLVTDGKQHYRNETGNPGMATGGSGDILTGTIAALIGQGYGPFDSACVGAHIHGLAGDRAAAKFGQISMIATDILDAIPKAFQLYQANSHKQTQSATDTCETLPMI
jgi:ADP-dependent NAD(P)H-hydrate dehydratase